MDSTLFRASTGQGAETKSDLKRAETGQKTQYAAKLWGS